MTSPNGTGQLVEEELEYPEYEDDYITDESLDESDWIDLFPDAPLYNNPEDWE